MSPSEAFGLDYNLAHAERAVGQAMEAEGISPEQYAGLYDLYMQFGDMRDALGRPTGSLSKPDPNWQYANSCPGFWSGAGDGAKVLVNDLTFGAVWADDADRARAEYGTAFAVTSKVTAFAIHALMLEGVLSVGSVKLIPYTAGATGGALGLTSGLGQITIQAGLTGRVLVQTLRHEWVHRILSPLYGPTWLRALRARWVMSSYNRFPFMRFLEEFLAESVATLNPFWAFWFAKGYVAWATEGARFAREVAVFAAWLGLVWNGSSAVAELEEQNRQSADSARGVEQGR